MPSESKYKKECIENTHNLTKFLYSFILFRNKTYNNIYMCKEPYAFYDYINNEELSNCDVDI